MRDIMRRKSRVCMDCLKIEPYTDGHTPRKGYHQNKADFGHSDCYTFSCVPKPVQIPRRDSTRATGQSEEDPCSRPGKHAQCHSAWATCGALGSREDFVSKGKLSS